MTLADILVLELMDALMDQNVKEEPNVVLEFRGDLDPVVIEGLIHHHNTSEPKREVN